MTKNSSDFNFVYSVHGSWRRKHPTWFFSFFGEFLDLFLCVTLSNPSLASVKKNIFCVNIFVLYETAPGKIIVKHEMSWKIPRSATEQCKYTPRGLFKRWFQRSDLDSREKSVFDPDVVIDAELSTTGSIQYWPIQQFQCSITMQVSRWWQEIPLLTMFIQANNPKGNWNYVNPYSFSFQCNPNQICWM